MASSSMELRYSAEVFEEGKQFHTVRSEDVTELRTVAMWNLAHDYTAETLRADLFEVDFVPKEIFWHRGEVWQIVMPNAAMATAMKTVFDFIDPDEKVLKPFQRDTATAMPIRVALWGEVAARAALLTTPKETVSTKPPVSFAPDTCFNVRPLLAKKHNPHYGCESW